MKPYHYDVIIIADGAGTVVEKSCGWAAKYYSKDNKKYQILNGFCSNGTNNLAELLPFFHSLWFDFYKFGVNNPSRNCLLISDSELTVRQGQRKYSRNGSSNMLWSGLDWLEGSGYTLSWLHIKREKNTRMDGFAKFSLDKARKYGMIQQS